MPSPIRTPNPNSRPIASCSERRDRDVEADQDAEAGDEREQAPAVGQIPAEVGAECEQGRGDGDEPHRLAEEGARLVARNGRLKSGVDGDHEPEPLSRRVPCPSRPGARNPGMSSLCTSSETSFIVLAAYSARASVRSQRPEGGADLVGEELRLLPGGEVAAPVDLVEVGEVGVATSRPSCAGSARSRRGTW